MKKQKYTEPTDYIPKSVRKEFELGEFNKDTDTKKRDLNKEFRDYVNGEKK